MLKCLIKPAGLFARYLDYCGRSIDLLLESASRRQYKRFRSGRVRGKIYRISLASKPQRKNLWGENETVYANDLNELYSR